MQWERRPLMTYQAEKIDNYEETNFGGDFLSFYNAMAFTLRLR